VRIFICPLDWGLGHAARCIPIIRYLLEKKIEVVIGAEGKHLIFLKEHFPTLEYIDFQGYRIIYSKLLPVGVMVSLQTPQMIYTTKKEHAALQKVIKEKRIDAIISDNRYGLWSKDIPCVIMTHQLNIQGKVLNKPASKVTHTYIKKFNECWIPDYEGEGTLSGTLAHPIPKGINGKYVGPLSRFEHPTPQTTKGTLNSITQSPFKGLGQKFDLLAIISGPEPQRSTLEDLLLKELKTLPSAKALIIQGLPGAKPKESGLRNVEIVPHLADKEFEDAVNSSDVVLCRAGYSTLMDLNAIGWKKSIFIPTPGQTEQEYLSEMLQEKGHAVTFNQKGFSLKKAMEKVSKINPTQPIHSEESYKEVIDAWLKKIN
jgi:hypothetical protein